MFSQYFPFTLLMPVDLGAFGLVCYAVQSMTRHAPGSPAASLSKAIVPHSILGPEIKAEQREMIKNFYGYKATRRGYCECNYGASND